jgi:hypothetical protein
VITTETMPARSVERRDALLIDGLAQDLIVAEERAARAEAECARASQRAERAETVLRLDAGESVPALLSQLAAAEAQRDAYREALRQAVHNLHEKQGKLTAAEQRASEYRSQARPERAA